MEGEVRGGGDERSSAIDAPRVLVIGHTGADEGLHAGTTQRVRQVLVVVGLSSSQLAVQQRVAQQRPVLRPAQPLQLQPLIELLRASGHALQGTQSLVDVGIADAHASFARELFDHGVADCQPQRLRLDLAQPRPALPAVPVDLEAGALDAALRRRDEKLVGGRGHDPAVDDSGAVGPGLTGAAGQSHGRQSGQQREQCPPPAAHSTAPAAWTVIAAPATATSAALATGTSWPRRRPKPVGGRQRIRRSVERPPATARPTLVSVSASPPLKATISASPKPTRCSDTAESSTTSAEGQGTMPPETPSSTAL